MFFKNMGSTAAAADAEDDALVPIMNGLTFAGRGQCAGRFAISQSESRTVESAKSLIESG